MKIAGEQTLSAPRERVWALFNDPERLSRLIPGCEKLDVISPTEFAGTLNVGIAAVKGVYTGKLKLDEVRPPEHYKMSVDGKGKQGFMRGVGHARSRGQRRETNRRHLWRRYPDRRATGPGRTARNRQRRQDDDRVSSLLLPTRNSRRKRPARSHGKASCSISGAPWCGSCARSSRAAEPSRKAHREAIRPQSSSRKS